MPVKAREPMTRPDEIIDWANETVKANGEAFTMLKKEEQLLIAKFILAMRDHIKKLQSVKADEEKPEADKTVEESPAPTPPQGVEQEDPAPERVMVDETVRVRQTNMEFFKANSISMQRAYQLFEVWAKCDPNNRIILDEERKAYVKSASFAFWLNLPHE